MDQKKKAIIYLLFTTAFWGGNFVIGRVVVQYLSPFMMSFGRWTIALSLLIPLMVKKGLPNREELIKHWKSILIMAITGVFGFNTLVYFAVKYTTSVNAALVNSLTPVVIVILSALFLAERLTARQLSGVFLSLIGVLVVISQGSLQTFFPLQLNLGDMIMVVAVFLWGIYSILMKKVTKTISSLTVTTLSAIIGWILLIPFAVWEFISADLIQLNLTSISGLFYIGIFASVLAFLGWNEGVIHLGPGKSSVFLNLIPVFAALFSFVFLHEGLSWYQLIGGFLVVMGVMMTMTMQHISRQNRQ